MDDRKSLIVNVDGLGKFEFAQRTMRDEIRIGAEYSRLTEGVERPSPWLSAMADMIATIKVLLIQGPAEWDPEALDPHDPDSYAQIMKVHTLLRGEEERFRRRKNPAGEASREGAGGEPGVLVPAPIQAAAE